MLEGVKFMEGDYPTAILAVGGTFVLLSRERVPAMLVLLLFGAVVAVARQPALLDELGQMAFRFQLPHFALAALRWEDMLI